MQDDVLFCRHTAVVSCLTPLCSVHGKAVTTVEGVGNLHKLHPVQVHLYPFFCRLLIQEHALPVYTSEFDMIYDIIISLM